MNVYEFDQLMNAASSGHIEAQYVLGYLLLTGQDGVKKNLGLAQQWLKLAAERGHFEARLALDDLLHELSASKNLVLNLHNLTFKSGHHYRIENGVEVGGGAANRTICIVDSISGKEGYSVTIYDNDGVHPSWKDNVSMSTKPMKIISSSAEKTELRGWGTYIVPMAGIEIPYSNYGLTIYHKGGEIEKMILHMFDRNIDIRYEL